MIRLLSGDCRDVLATLPADSVQCVVTSPPYYGLRDYGCAGQIGLEPTPDEYLATMVAVFREVRRVLRPDGTCWVNMGDSYASSTTNNGGYSAKSTLAGFTNPATKGRIANDSTTPQRIECNAKPKDLLMMPARLALALQADGWWLRSDIIWHKPSPMPESVTDRPTGAHEHVFLLTKSARYFYDGDAVREPYNEATPGRYDSPMMGVAPGARQIGGDVGRREREKAVRDPNPAGRNLRNVWTITTAPYSGAHFATYPPALAERCIRAGTSERGCCSQCGKPWGRQTETGYIKNPNTWGKSSAGRTVVTGSNNWDGGAYPNLCKQVTTTGWAPSCACGADTVPCTVLDPFAGAGTTLLVADRLQRDAIGVELNVEYTRMAMQRCRDDAPLFADMPPAADPEDERMADLFAEAAE